jgi:histidinol-phosphate aminotransferase
VDFSRKELIKSYSKLHAYRIHQRLLARSQYWSADQFAAYQLERLRRTLVAAQEGTAYYRALFKSIGFDARGDFKSMTDLAALPILAKETVRQQARALVDRRFLATSTLSETSGTTGQPLRMQLGEAHLAFDSACVFRHMSWAGYRFRSRMAYLRTYVPSREGQPLWRFSRARNTLYLSAYHLTPRNCHDYIERILEFRPEYIRAYPSSMVVFAEYAYPVREKFAFVKGIFTSSETLLPTEREVIEATFGRKLYDWYGMGEPAVVLTECEAHEGLHINAEYGFAELLPADDLPANERRLVTTGFHNPVMPFIRYETGDIVRLLDAPRVCSCGRNLPLVHSIAGRKDEAIVTPDGRRLPSVNFYSVFREYPDIIRFQMVQYGLGEVQVNLLLRAEALDPGAWQPRLVEELRVRLGPDIQIGIKITDRFVTNSDGKTPPIMRKFGTKSVEENEEYAISSQRAWSWERAAERVYKLDWNEADIMPVPQVKDALHKLIDSDPYLCWYPDAQSRELHKLLAEYVGVSEANITLTHGSDLAMELLATCFIKPRDNVVIVSPTYDNFRAVVEQRGAETRAFTFLGDEPFPTTLLSQVLIQSPPRILYLNNPNNPIGYTVDRSTIGKLLDVCRRTSTLLLVDEAYYEFSGVTVGDLVEAHPQLVVLRTFSKAFGLAGLRLGYIISTSSVARVLSRVNNPKSVTMLAAAAAQVALVNRERVAAYVREVGLAKEKLYAFCDAQGLAYRRSDGNFVLLRTDRPQEMVAALEARHVLVRDRTRYFSGVGHVRVTVGTLRSTEALIDALAGFLDPGPRSS